MLVLDGIERARRVAQRAWCEPLLAHHGARRSSRTQRLPRGNSSVASHAIHVRFGPTFLGRLYHPTHTVLRARPKSDLDHSYERLSRNMELREPLGMMNRRQLVHAGAAGAVLLPRVPKVLAATYDLIIKGGRVIDPSVGLESERQSRARYSLHGLECHFEDHRDRRFSERHVEVPHAWYAA